MVSVPNPIVLSASSGSLSLTIDEDGVGGWCKVHLLTERTDRPLGAERVKYIATQLRSFLADSSPSRRWVLSLAELHTSAYGEHAEGETIIELQDGNAKWFARLVLSPAERSEWIRELSRHV
jgi:hypothetical protein